jgi:hypothetical protein
MGNFWSDRNNFLNQPRTVQTYGPEKCIQIDYDLTLIANGEVTYTCDLNNDATLDGFSTGDVFLPAYSSVTRCIIIPTVAAAGGTSIKLGTFALTGAEIDDDYIITTTAGAKTALDTIGGRCYGDGVGLATTVETASVGSADAYLAFTGSGTFTAGKGKIYIFYIDASGV